MGLEPNQPHSAPEAGTPGSQLNVAETGLDNLVSSPRHGIRVQLEMLRSKTRILRLDYAAKAAREPLVGTLIHEDSQLARWYLNRISPQSPSSSEFLARMESEISSHRSGVLRAKDYVEGKQRVEELERQLQQAVVERNTSVAYVREAVGERKEKESILTEFADQLSFRRCVVHPATPRGPTGGIVGLAVALAHGIRSVAPNAAVCVAHSLDELSGADVHFDLPESRHGASIIHTNEITDHDFVVAVTPTLCGYWSRHDLEVPPFGQIFGVGTGPRIPLAQFGSVSPETLFPPVSFDMADPRGTILIEPRMQGLRAQRDAWSLSEWKTARLGWLEREVPAAQREVLLSMAAKEGWAVDGATWGMAYLQKHAPFWDELKLIVRNRERLIAQGLDHVVIHLRPGVCMGSSLSIPPGVRLIRENGEVTWGGCARDEAPFVTVVVHDTIQHDSFLQGLAQMAGVPQRIESIGAWTDFPVWVTGAASWSEAVSAGAIPLHDRVDWKFDKEEQIEAALIKHCIVTSSIVTSSDSEDMWEDFSARARSLVPSFILGHYAHEERYADLAAWSILARSFSNSMRMFNSAVDIAWCLLQQG
jgi:hypothetical protein